MHNRRDLFFPRFFGKTILYLSVFLLLISCNSEVELPVPDAKLPVTVNAIFTPDSLMKVEVYRAYSFYDTLHPFKPVNNATVTATASSGHEFTFMNKNDVYISNGYPEYGETYTLKVSVPGYGKTIESVTSIPKRKPDIQLEGFGYDFGPSKTRYKQGYLDISLDDRAGEENFYAVSVLAEYTFNNYHPSDSLPAYTSLDTTVNYWGIWIIHPGCEPIIDNTSQMEFRIDGKYFDGEKTGIRIWTRTSQISGFPGIISFDIIVKEVNRDYYKYTTQYTNQVTHKDEPWSEPVSVYTNIQNGLGIFSAFTESHIFYKPPVEN